MRHENRKKQRAPRHEPIAIVGIGCRFPGNANDPDSYWNLLSDGVDAITEVPEDRWNVREYFNESPGIAGKTYSKWGGFVKDIDAFDPEPFGISPREAAHMDPQQRMLLEVSWRALEDATIPMTRISNTRTGVFVGISTRDYGHLLNTDATRVDGYSATGEAASIAANRISYWLNACGPSIAIDTACSSALVATHLACQSIWSNESELALAGGVNAILTPAPYIAFCAAGMLSPVGRCKAFDASADGFVRAEGAGVVVLKRLSEAVKDGNPIYATIAGTGVNQDGRTSGIALPSQKAQETLVRAVCTQAGISPEHVDYVEAHGTGTPAGDPVEANALGRVLSVNRDVANSCIMGSVKTNIGHLESGAGIAGLIKAALTIKHRKIPPSLHFKEPNPNIPFEELKLRIPATLEEWPEKSRAATVAINSFGFGGTNAHALLVEHRGNGRVRRYRRPAPPWLLPLSASSAEGLGQLVESYRPLLLGKNGKPPKTPLADVCYTASVGRAHFQHRLAIVADSCQQLGDQLDAFRSGESSLGMSTGQAHTDPATPALVFSGQGPQWWGMGQQLLQREVAFRRMLEQCDALLSTHANWSLLEEMSKDEESSRIQETAIAQPALFALQVGLLELWRSWGVEPKAVIGHSVGEVAAAYAAGVLSLADAVKVIFYRGQCMDTASSRGRMLAVGLSPEKASALLRGLEDRISIAAVNSPSSATLSGEPEALDGIAQSLQSEGVFCRFLRVSYAFHSPQMEPVREPLLAALDGIEPRPARLPMTSTVTGAAVAGAELTADYWWQNVRQTVRFAQGFKQLLTGECSAFVELSPHPVLSSAMREILSETRRTGCVLHSLRRQENERGQMLRSLGALYTAGYPLEWERVWPRQAARVALPQHPFKREQYWHETQAQRKKRLESYRHPLLGKRADTAQPLFLATLDTKVLRYLDDHRVQEQRIFPGSAYVEMGLAAGRELFGGQGLTLEEIHFQKALFLSDSGEAPTIQFTYNNDDASYAIESRTSSVDEEWILHTLGYLRPLEQSIPVSTVDRHSIETRMREFPARDFYEIFRTLGIQYGPRFQGIQRLWHKDGEALAQVVLSHDCRPEADQYRFHPALLDSCFQVILGTILREAEPHGLYLPVYIEKVSFFGRPSDRVWTHVELRHFSKSTIEADIRVLDLEGRSLCEINRFRCQLVEGQKAADPGDWLYETRWHEKSLAVALSPGIATSLAPLREIVLWASDRTTAFDQELGFSQAASRAEPLLNRLTAAYLWRALRLLGQTCEPGDEISLRRLIDQGCVLSRHERVFRRFMKFLARTYGLTEIREDLWRIDGAAMDRGPEEIWRETFRSSPAALCELTLLDRIGRHLHEVLRGEVDPVALLFPDGSLEDTERFYESSIATTLPNLALAQCIQRLVEGLPQGRTIRILEVGGGTGGMTAQILPLLPPTQTRYVFSDISTALLSKAEQKFSHFPFVEFAILDIEQEPASQGFLHHSFDLVLASQVLHATHDLRKTLMHVAGLLEPAGLLMFLEAERVPIYTDLIFGLLDGWWRFTDFQLRPDYPLIDGARWTSLLHNAGFDDVERVSSTLTLRHSSVAILARVAAPSDRALPSDAIVTPAGSQWLLFTDRDKVGQELAAMLCHQGADVVYVHPGQTFRRLDEERYEINPSCLEDVEKLCRTVIEPSDFRGIVHLWNLNADSPEETTADSLREAERLGCHALVHIVQVLEKLALRETSNRLICVTRNAQPIGDQLSSMSVPQSMVVGLCRVIFNEYPNIQSKLVDLDASDDPASNAKSLLIELITDDSDREVALRKGVRFVPRAQLFVGETERVRSASRFRLANPKPGGLDRLLLVEAEAPELGAKEVEIEVVTAALNFRDVMKALFPFFADSPDAALWGGECAGRITRVGKDVFGAAIGEAVMATAPGSFASHVVVSEEFVTKMPKHLSFADATTMPLAFLTAYYALVQIAQLRKGERVMIHSATGGVGLAAVQIAQSIGAEVYATAGSAGKRRLLEQMGVHRAMDSRSLAFADEALKESGGRGVDVVLNSLAGQAIPKGIACLAPRGRFVELGKRDIYLNSKLPLWNFRKNLSYFAVDLTQLLTEPDLMEALWAQFQAMLRDHTFYPLPRCVFPISRSVEAFRFMAQAKHVGKIVLSLHDANTRVRRARPDKIELRSNGTYLITGGFGGYGLSVAQWCIDRGAGCIVLMGRHGAATEEARARIARLKKSDALVIEATADVTNEGEVTTLLERIDRTLPPLRGIFHLAMVLDDALVLQLTPERFTNVTAPKAYGAWNLHKGTLHRKLDLFVAFSSVSSWFGNPGQANYAAGNAFLDALAHYRRAHGLPATAINWGALQGVGYMARHELRSTLINAHDGLAPDEAMAALDRILSENPPQIAAVRANWAKLQRVAAGNVEAFASLIPQGAEGAQAVDAGPGIREAIAQAPDGQKQSLLEAYLKSQVATTLGISPDKLDPTRPLNEVGLDSLIGVELKNRLERDLSVSLPVSDLMQDPSIDKLVSSLSARLGFDPRDGISTGVPPPTDPVARIRTSVVPLSSRQGPEPLFCFCSLGEELGVYANLVRQLPSDRAVFGVQSRLSVTDEPYCTLADLAAGCARSIRAAQVHGPYRLLGFSAGGYFAMATAHALEAAGEEIRFVALLDSDIRWTDPRVPRQELFTTLLTEIEQLLTPGAEHPSIDRRSHPMELADFVARLLLTSWDERARMTVQWAREQLGDKHDFHSDDLKRFISAIYAQLQMLENARLERVRAPLLVWRARETLVGDFRSTAMWASYTETGVVENTLDANHYSIMAMPAIAEIAAELSTIGQQLSDGELSLDSISSGAHSPGLIKEID